MYNGTISRIFGRTNPSPIYLPNPSIAIKNVTSAIKASQNLGELMKSLLMSLSFSQVISSVNVLTSAISTAIDTGVPSDLSI